MEVTTRPVERHPVLWTGDESQPSSSPSFIILFTRKSYPNYLHSTLNSDKLSSKSTTMSKKSENPMRQKGYNPLGGATMAIGRALDPVLQYSLLRKGYAGQLLHLAGFKRIITLPLVNRVGLNADFWGPGLIDKPGNMLLAMSGITALRHVRLDGLVLFGTARLIQLMSYRSTGLSSPTTLHLTLEWQPLSLSTTVC